MDNDYPNGVNPNGSDSNSAHPNRANSNAGNSTGASSNGANSNGVNQNGVNPLYESTERNRRSWPPHFQPQYSEPPTQPGAHTLPPIHPQRPSYDHGAASFDQHSRQQPSLYSTQGTPYPTYVTHNSHHAYPHGMPHFPGSSSMIAPSIPTVPMSQGYGTTSSGAFHQIRPMPPSTSTHGHQMPLAYGPHPSFGFPNPNDDNDLHPRTHVVGSQGRRGILPSDEGRPAAVNTNGNTPARSTVAPVKDADGKFPCPHCTKQYLHGKHLKRHMLRHTGDRPYSCILCEDTFSRSDILKRHFQKCSIRRGNPTGATHLAGSQSQMRKQSAKKAQAPSGINTNFAGQTPGGPHSASPIYNDAGLGMVVGHSASQPQPDTSRSFHDGTSTRDQRSYTNPATSFNRPNFNFATAQNGAASLPSSGSSTPLTAKANGHFHPPFAAEPPHQRINSYGDINTRSSQAQAPSSQFDGNAFEWPPYPHVKEDGDNHVGQPANETADPNGDGHTEPKSQQGGPGPIDQHDEFMPGFRG